MVKTRTCDLLIGDCIRRGKGEDTILGRLTLARRGLYEEAPETVALPTDEETT